jgi:peptidoglycan/xylan/chitin deacetylase (PgdA/CDA1 family)
VAVSLVVNYEAGSEYSIWAGDDRSEGVGEFGMPINPTSPDVRDLCTESTFEYGSRAGIWRLARILDEYDIKVTFYCCGQALELNPAVGEYIETAGHEPCAHGWRWEELWRLSREEEREHLHLAIESIAKTCGTRPVGWFSRCVPSVHTRELIVEEGGFLYDSDAYNDDLPYFVEVGDHRHLVIPYSFTYNDMRFVFPGFADPMSFFTYCKMGLDQLWEEGATHPKMMSIGLHPRWIGQAARAKALRAFIDYALEKGDVWFARKVDIANWWLAHHEEFKP